jgi:hypothetical protein
VTGYLVWGYFIIYIFMLAIGAVILLMRLFLASSFWLNLIVRLIPVFVVIVIKFIVKLIFTQFIFLNRSSKILAIKNFRAFNIFLYFNFFFDCFMGAISAVIRLAKALVIAILMLPSIRKLI